MGILGESPQLGGRIVRKVFTRLGNVGVAYFGTFSLFFDRMQPFSPASLESWPRSLSLFLAMKVLGI